MKSIQIDKNLIKAEAQSKFAAEPAAKFSTVLDGFSTMGPATAELTNQWTGNNRMASAVLNAAFSGLEVGRAVSPSSYGGAGGFGGYGGYGASAAAPGYMGAPKYAGPTDGNPAFSPTGGDVAGTGMSPDELMNTMNMNNLRLLELQAMMQSNMQRFTTLSNINSADHRARMSMIEKFTARG